VSTKPIGASRAIQEALRRLSMQQSGKTAGGASARTRRRESAKTVEPESRSDPLAELDPSQPDAQPLLLSAFVEQVLSEHFGRSVASDPAFADLVARTRDTLLVELRKTGNAVTACQMIQRALASPK